MQGSEKSDVPRGGRGVRVSCGETGGNRRSKGSRRIRSGEARVGGVGIGW